MSATVVTTESHVTTNEKCCCCISLRAGTISIGIISAIIGVLGIVNGLGLIVHNNVQVNADEQTYTARFSNSFSITQLVSSFILVVVSVLLVIGVIMRISLLFLAIHNLRCPRSSLLCRVNHLAHSRDGPYIR
ncbi:hypothetical protein M3Y94_00600600 [Aphelenchoides besseyi]|nr:hypothetical protein M3Y94_00600600 [Aphelenchoides besseyi]